eukprot:1045283_1
MSYSLPLSIIVILYVLCCDSLSDQGASFKGKKKGRARKLLAAAGDAQAAPRRWDSEKRPMIIMQGNYRSGRPHGFDEANTLFEEYNKGAESDSFNKLRLVFIGDQGGFPGKALEKQVSDEYKATVAAIARRHAIKPYHAIFTVGDNVYNDGISTDREGFELMNRFNRDVWTDYAPGLANVPLFAVLGNHDHCKHPLAQVMYSQQQMIEALRHGAYSGGEGVRHPIWIQPDLFYHVRFQFGPSAKNIHLMMLDTMINRAEKDRFTGCHDPVSKMSVRAKQQLYKDHLKPEQKRFVKQTLEEMAALRSEYNYFGAVVAHHAPLSTFKWRGDDSLLELLDSMREMHPMNLIKAVFAGHDHAFEFGVDWLHWRGGVRNFANAVIGGTRSCASWGFVNGIRDWIGDVGTGRIFTGIRHAKDRRYWDYWWPIANPRNKEGWRGCQNGGFVEVIFEDMGPRIPVKGTIRYFSGNGVARGAQEPAPLYHAQIGEYTGAGVDESVFARKDSAGFARDTVEWVQSLLSGTVYGQQDRPEDDLTQSRVFN